MDTDRRKTVTITILVVLAFGAALGYYYVQKSSAPGVRPAIDTAQDALPSIGEAANPLSNKPDLNPASKTNPFDSVKTNPFD